MRATDIDGVPAFHVDGPAPYRAGLTFRVGSADETLPERGLTHLVEHLVMFGLEREHAEVVENAAVDATTTRFFLTGDPDEVAAGLTAIARGLAELPLDRLADEVRVLRTERRRVGGSLMAAAPAIRYGAHGYGLLDAPELGLRSVDGERVEAWRTRWFTRGNAALWFSGPPPAGVDLSALPPGERIPPPVPVPRVTRLPAWYHGPDGFVIASMTAKRSTPAAAGVEILGQRLHERLRTGEARSYDAASHYFRWTEEHAEVAVVADTLPDDGEAVRDAIAVELRRFASEGPAPEEIEGYRRRVARAEARPDSSIGQAFIAAEEHLLSGQPPDPARIDAEIAELTPPVIAAAMQALLGTLLWLVPAEVGVHDQRVRFLSDLADPPAAGEDFRPVSGGADVLRVADDAVAVLTHDGRAHVARFDDCAAAARYDDGAWTLYVSDGRRLPLHPWWWHDGARALGLVAERLDPAIVVAMGEPAPFAPEEEPEPERRGPLGRLRRRRR